MTHTAGFRVRKAAPGDLPPVLALLEAADLPRDGVEEAFSAFVVAEADGRIIGTAGLEHHGPYALLRSVAVDPAWRSLHVGAALVERLLDTADRKGVRGVYLLTTTADRYFPRFGFESATRDEIPQELHASAEFRGACPASARAMHRRPGSAVPNTVPLQPS